MYFSSSFIALFLSYSEVSTNSSCYPLSLNRPRTPLRASLGSFLLLTVLIRSGTSKLFSFFTKCIRCRNTGLNEVLVLGFSEERQSLTKFIDGFDSLSTSFSEVVPAHVGLLSHQFLDSIVVLFYCVNLDLSFLFSH